MTIKEVEDSEAIIDGGDVLFTGKFAIFCSIFLLQNIRQGSIENVFIFFSYEMYILKKKPPFNWRDSDV